MVKREHVHRFIWGFMAVLFVGTALGVGIYAFIVNTHNNPSSNYIKCSNKSVGQQKPGKNGKYEGAQLVGYTPVKSIDYVYCQDLKVGTGATATTTSTITANYTGALASSGKIFQSSLGTGQLAEGAVSSGFIQGWAAGIPGMKVSGTRRLFIPAQYAYGATGAPQGGIPPNSDLVFDVSLLAVK